MDGWMDGWDTYYVVDTDRIDTLDRWVCKLVCMQEWEARAHLRAGTTSVCWQRVGVVILHAARPMATRHSLKRCFNPALFFHKVEAVLPIPPEAD
jgi:hypothetical protein